MGWLIKKWSLERQVIVDLTFNPLTCSWEITALLTKCCSCSLAKLIHSCSKLFTPRSCRRTQKICDVTSNTTSFQISVQDTNLKPIDVHYPHCTVHLCGTQPVIDLLQQPVKQHWIQGFGNGISTREKGGMCKCKLEQFVSQSFQGWFNTSTLIRLSWVILFNNS